MTFRNYCKVTQLVAHLQKEFSMKFVSASSGEAAWGMDTPLDARVADAGQTPAVDLPAKAAAEEQ